MKNVNKQIILDTVKDTPLNKIKANLAAMESAAFGKTWNRVLAMKPNDNRHQGVANTLTRDEINTILSTLSFMGATDGELAQDFRDLAVSRFRVFDWLGMRVDAGTDIYNPSGTKVMVHSFLKVNGDVNKFIADLRSTDYEIDTSWEGVALEDEVAPEQAAVPAEEAYVPKNIAKFANQKGAGSLVRKAATWAEKCGAHVGGGTAIGKYYGTIILDLTYQGSEIYIDTDDMTIELHGKLVNNFADFKKVYDSKGESEEDEPEVTDADEAVSVDVSDRDTQIQEKIKELGLSRKEVSSPQELVMGDYFISHDTTEGGEMSTDKVLFLITSDFFRNEDGELEFPAAADIEWVVPDSYEGGYNYGELAVDEDDTLESIGIIEVLSAGDVVSADEANIFGRDVDTVADHNRYFVNDDQQVTREDFLRYLHEWLTDHAFARIMKRLENGDEVFIGRGLARIDEEPEGNWTDEDNFVPQYDAEDANEAGPFKSDSYDA